MYNKKDRRGASVSEGNATEQKRSSYELLFCRLIGLLLLRRGIEFGVYLQERFTQSAK